jgi:spore germination protein GerM
MNRSTPRSWLIRATMLGLSASLAACSVGASPQPAATPAASPTLAPPSSATPSASAAPIASVGPTAEPSPDTIALKVYFVMVGDREDSPLPLVAVNRDVPWTKAVATAAMERLLDGPSLDERAHNLRLGTIGTLIPEGTRLLGLEIDHGVATVDLSGGFESGSALGVDGPAAWASRLAQVTYTLTQFPSVERVSFKLDGVPTKAIEGHEGTPLDQVGRNAYFDQLPGIFIDEPAWGAAITDPLKVSGIAQVGAEDPQLEAALVDPATDEIIARQTVRPQCTDCWLPPGGSPFELQLSVPGGVGREMLLRISELGPDGSVLDMREYPMR